MFSIIFPGQGSQSVGMCKELYLKYDIVKKLFNEADEALNYSLTKIIFEGPKEILDKTENTQPAIFLVGYSIFTLMREKFNFNFDKALFFAGHSLGEYTALCSAGFINFSDTIKILKIRGAAMQSSSLDDEGGMIAVLGSSISEIDNILNKNLKNYECFIANDNSNSQIVISGKIEDLKKFSEDLKKKSIKNIPLSVSAPFHCKLMNKATKVMELEIKKMKFNSCNKTLISNVTAGKMNEIPEIKNLLIKQIESRVRWRESIKYMTDNGTKSFIEIGPGKVLSGLIKRINKNLKTFSINSEGDINTIIKDNEF